MPTGYKQVGVRSAEEMPAFAGALASLRGTFGFPQRGRPVTEFGLYASVLDIGGNVGVAVSTDGVGTKLLVAQELGKYDTVGIDCVAMNANDILCVGAEPLALVDYVALETAEGTLLEEIAAGLVEGARRARISIPGGETAQVPEILHGASRGQAFDLVGTCVGVVPVDRIIDGSAVAPGDALVGFASSGIHSNGFTLARAVFQRQAGWKLDSYVPEFGRTLGEELLTPTTMYVELAMELMSEVEVHALAHITGDGLLNLRRTNAKVGFDIERLPEPPPVFQLIKGLGEVAEREMRRVFNMGVGFCAVVPARLADEAVAMGRRHGVDGWVLGRATDSEPKLVRLLPVSLASEGDHFVESA